MSLADRLAARTLELVGISSVSRDEERIAAHVASLVPQPAFRLHDAEDTCLLYSTERRPGAPLVVLAGHVDTVPAQGNFPGRMEDGAVVGLGASDMKGGVAVMLELARDLAAGGAAPDVDVALLFFGREELAMEESPLTPLLGRAPWVREAGLVVMLEPTDNELHAGCMGNINAELVFHGESAHSARPWTGVNAVDVAVEGLLPVTRLGHAEVEIEGLTFVEALSVTGIRGGIARNVIPDRVECDLNFRYSPLRTPEDAAARLAELAGGAGDLEIASNSPSGRVVTSTPLVRRLRDAGDLAVRPKQAWTPVAEFSLHGLDAVNLGPGATRYAHKRDERIEATELARCYETLWRFLFGTSA